MLQCERRGANVAARVHRRCEILRNEIKRCLREFRVSNVRTTPTGAELRMLAPKLPLPGRCEVSQREIERCLRDDCVSNVRTTPTGAELHALTSEPPLLRRCEVPRSEVERCLRDYCVSNVRTTPTGAKLRVLAPEPPLPGAVPEEATLEDVFMHYFGEKGDGEDAAI